MKPTRTRRWSLVAAIAAVAVFAAASLQAQPGASAPAALVIYPRVEVRDGVDTEIYLANTSIDAAHVYCVYTDGLGHCSGTGTPCQPAVGCAIAGQACITACTQTDFRLTLTPRQILSWRARQGLAAVPVPPIGAPGDGVVPPVATDPFIGQLRCVEVDEAGSPVARNDLLGSASTLGPDFSTASYESVEIRSLGLNDGDKMLCLGANATGDCTTAEYAGCPNGVSVNHFFEGAMIGGAAVHNRLSLVPCSLFYRPRPGHADPDRVSVDLSLRVFNEFEQETVLPFTATCFVDIALSALPAFAISAQGTLAGQTFVRGGQADPDAGPGIVGVLEQSFDDGANSSSSAHGLTSLGTAAHADPITLLDF